ncbi:unnamed protein product [Mucor fragilis]
MAIEVIGAGLGRTGTSSFCEALDILGYKCHHMKRCLEDPTNQSSKRFYDAFLNKSDANWDEVYEGYTAAADWTAAHFYKDLLARYPNAKVVLTERPFDDWYKSMKNTIYPAIRNGQKLQPGHPHYEFRELNRQLILDGYIEDEEKFLDEELMRNYYDNHLKQVNEVVPANQLYTFKLGEGWEGLCEFLGKSVPEVPYPNVNSTAHFQNKFIKKPNETATDPVPELNVGDA